LIISAPLDMLYSEMAVFKVTFDNHETLEAHCKLSLVVHVNEPKWLILSLVPESAPSIPSSPVRDETDTEAHPPTLRLKLCLSGPYRPEIKALMSVSGSWFQVVDALASTTSSTLTSITSAWPNKLPTPKIFLVPTVPLAAVVVAILPVLLGIMTVGLPFFLPILVIILTVAVTGLVMGTGLYLSSSSGRDTASIVLGPIMSTFCATSSGQRLLYETGPRPSPVALAETVMPSDMIGQLIVSLVIDFIGSSSYLLPGVGEAFDVAWAPIQTIFLTAMYDKTMPSLKYISFAEEILPFTDVLPSGTLGWVRCWSPLVIDQCFKKVDEMRLVAQRNP